MNPTVEMTMKIWKQFCNENGGAKKLNANVLWKWPGYRVEKVYIPVCFKEAMKIISESKSVEVIV